MKATARRAAAELPDNLNPAFIFSLTATELLLEIAAGRIDAQALARQELADRGVDATGAWVGFTAAEKIWKTR